MPYFDIIATNTRTGRKNKKRYKAADLVQLRSLAEGEGLEVVSWSEVTPLPATERQIAYARNLGATFPASITVDEMSHLISRFVDGDEASPEWLVEWALERFPEEKGTGISWYQGVGALLRFLAYRFGEGSDPRLLLRVWVCAVAVHLSRTRWTVPFSGLLPPDVLDATVELLAADPKALKSVRRYEPESWRFFGERTDAEGYLRRGASTASYAYQRTCELLRERGVFG